MVRIRCECELRIIRIQFAADLSELANSRICEFNLVKLNGLVSYLIAHNHAGEFIEFYSEFERIANNSLIRQFATSELANCKTMGFCHTCGLAMLHKYSPTFALSASSRAAASQ